MATDPVAPPEGFEIQSSTPQLPDGYEVQGTPSQLEDKFTRFAVSLGKTFDTAIEGISSFAGFNGISNQYKKFSAEDVAALTGQSPATSGIFPSGNKVNPASNEDVSSKIAQGAGAAAGMIAPTLATGGLGAAATLGVLGSSSAYAETRDEAEKQGKTEDEANEEGLKSAGMAAVALPLYFGAGKLASSLVRPLLGTNTLTRGIISGTAAAAANVGASTTIRAVEGEDATPTPESLTQDILFGALHGFGEAQLPNRVAQAATKRDQIETMFDEGAKKVQEGTLSQDDYDASVAQVKPLWNGLNQFLQKPESQRILGMQREAQPEISVAQEVGPATAQATEEIQTNEQNEAVREMDQPQTLEAPSKRKATSGQEESTEGNPNVGSGGLEATKIVDENGNPKIVYHGTASDYFDSFSLDKADLLGFHFGTAEQANSRLKQTGKEQSEGARILPVYLNIKNPVRIQDVPHDDPSMLTEAFRESGITLKEKDNPQIPNRWRVITAGKKFDYLNKKYVVLDEISPGVDSLVGSGDSLEEAKYKALKSTGNLWDFRKSLKDAGYDGVIYVNSTEGNRTDPQDSYIALYPSQIKQAFGGKQSSQSPESSSTEGTSDLGAGRLIYHGTSTPIDSLSDQYALTGDSRNIYGQGLYTTDSFYIANGYSKKGNGENPTIYKLTPKDTNLLDLEKYPTSQVESIVKQAMGDLYPTENIETGKRLKNLREIYDEFRSDSKYNDLSRDDVQDIFDEIRQNLENQGFGGYQHVGGLKTGNIPHSVKIFWNPEKQVSLSKISQGSSELGTGGIDNVKGLGNATQKEFEISRTINGGDIFNSLKSSLGHEPTQEEWQREFEKTHPELEQGEYDSLYQNSKSASDSYDESNGNKPMPEVVNQLLQPNSTENQQISSDQENGTLQTLSTKNEVTDQRRQEIGLTPAVEVVRKTDQTTWDNASRRIQEEPQYQDNLISELSRRPRAVTDEENAVLLHRQVALENQRNAVVKEINEANDRNDHASVVENRARLAALEDNLQDLYDVLKSSGTETARGLRARQAAALSDYSLTNMVARFRASKGGEALTQSERQRIQDLHDQLAEKDKQIQELLNSSEARNRESQAKDTFTRIEKEGKATKSQRTDKQKITDKISDKFKSTGKVTDLSSYVQRLALNFVREGVRGRDNVVNAVHDELIKIIPDIEKRQTEDLISGYGEFKQLDKEEAKTELRKYKGELQQVAKIEDLQKGIPPKKTGIERREVGIEESKLIKAVNELKRTTAFKNVDPETELRTALAEFKARTQRRIEELQDKIKNKDFAPKKAKTPIRLDEEALKLEAEKKRIQGEYEKEVEKNRLAERGTITKAQDTFVKYRRGFILSALSILEKLGAAAALRLASSHLEERVGGILSRIPGISQVASRAPREGGYSSTAEAKAISDAWHKTISEAGLKLKTGHDTLDNLYGPVNKIPQQWIDYFGNFHGALKTPAKIAEFARAYQKRMAFAIRNGEDPTDPFTQMKVGTEAYKDSKRAIFMQDNRLVSAYSLGLKRLIDVDKKTGKVPASGKILHTILNTELPIVKIPTNLVAEGIQFGFGSITGSARLATALARGVETLKPDEADLIMRELKKGSIGSAGLLIGFLGASTLNGFIQAGGFYEPEEKKGKNGEPKEGELKVGGEVISKNLLHAPIMETIQMGANMRKVADMELKKGKMPLTAYGYGLYRTVIGLVEQTAFLNQAVQVAKALDPREDTSFWGELAKSLAIPSLVSGLAIKGFNFNGHVFYAGDTDSAGNVIKRQTKTIPDYIKSGIPGLRETLPKKK